MSLLDLVMVAVYGAGCYAAGWYTALRNKAVSE